MAARVAEPEQAGAFVEGLARGVVERRTEPLRGALLPDREQERVAAARKEAEERRLDGVGPEVEGRDVPLEVVHGRERKTARPGQRLRGRDPDEERANEPRALRDRDEVGVVERGPSLLERSAYDRRDELEVAPGRDLGDDATVAGMEVGLRGDDRRQHPPVRRDDRCRGLVAGRLDPEDHGAPSEGAGSFHMTRASSRLSV
jgi:hypothetical protein